LVLLNPVRAIAYGDAPAPDFENIDDAMAKFKAEWGTPAITERLAPSLVGDATFSAWLARFCRVGNPPSMATAVMRAQLQSDLRHILPVIQTPTLVIQRSSEAGFVSRLHARLLAESIAGARLVEVPGTDLLPYVGDTTQTMDEISSFLTGARPNLVSDRVLATVLFTDIVASTERVVAMGDRGWRALLDRHHADAQDRIERFGGSFINTTGDGILATFDGPSRAIHCARAIREGAAGMVLEVRAGLHTGEVELMSNDIGGIAVHIAARVCALAGAGEVLVSSSVPPLVIGSGIEFGDRGDHELKGVPGTWRLFVVNG
jgi:class 3 adenylate cyclase